MVQVTNVIRNVVAYYTAEATVGDDATARVGSVLGRSWRWAWRWGLAATALMALLSPLLARFLHIPTPWPLWAASLALLLLFLRPVTDGALQGTQHFFGLGAVQVLQSLLRLLLRRGAAGVGATGRPGRSSPCRWAAAVALALALVLLRRLLSRAGSGRAAAGHQLALLSLHAAGPAGLRRDGQRRRHRRPPHLRRRRGRGLCARRHTGQDEPLHPPGHRPGALPQGDTAAGGRARPTTGAAAGPGGDAAAGSAADRGLRPVAGPNRRSRLWPGLRRPRPAAGLWSVWRRHSMPRSTSGSTTPCRWSSGPMSSSWRPSSSLR
jgi:hypothetical protein